MEQDLKHLLEKLHEIQIKALTERIESGEATGAEFAAANQLLKNNNITVDINTDDSLQELENSLKVLRKGKPKLELTEDDKQDLGFLRVAGGKNV